MEKNYINNMKKNNLIRSEFYLIRGQRDYIKKEAQKQKISYAQLVRKVLEAWMNKK